MITTQQWLEKGSFFEYGQYQIFFIDSGNHTPKIQKETLLLLHGFPTSSWDWHMLWPDLIRKFRVITLDFIGYGFSDKPTKHKYSFFEQADIVESLLHSLEISNYNILAHDYGDTVAQELLARDNQKTQNSIQSTILLNGGIIYEAIELALIQRLLLSPIGSIVARFMSFAKFKQNFDNICAIKRPNEELKNYWQLINHKSGTKVVHRLINYIRERKQFRDRWVSSLQNSTGPLTFINGTQDPISGKAMVDRFRQLVPNASVIELEKTGHYPQVESPSQTLSHSVEFWYKHLFLQDISITT
ncbi:MAG: alpha/beta hydrolase [Kangiellaceae bacterium]|nr:alpha/beta hydrolase [Kangiellaceae bacterium]MCW9017826.1 alpha/beta hydrolase [Kangiellaceae bacterium]